MYHPAQVRCMRDDNTSTTTSTSAFAPAHPLDSSSLIFDQTAPPDHGAYADSDPDLEIPCNQIQLWHRLWAAADIETRSELRATLTNDFAAEKDDTSFPMKPQKILWDAL